MNLTPKQLQDLSDFLSITRRYVAPGIAAFDEGWARAFVIVELLRHQPEQSKAGGMIYCPHCCKPFWTEASQEATNELSSLR